MTTVLEIPEKRSFQAASSSEAAGLISGANRNMAEGDASKNGGRAVANGKGLFYFVCFISKCALIYPFENVN